MARKGRRADSRANGSPTMLRLFCRGCECEIGLVPRTKEIREYLAKLAEAAGL